MKNYVSSNIFPRWAKPALAALIAVATTSLCAADIGTVQGNNCNVRSRPERKAEVVTQLNKGDTVQVVGQTSTEAEKYSEWLKIVVPDKATCFVSSAFVKGGEITADDVYVRCGPGKNFRDVGKLPQGQKVTVLGTKGEWTQIKPTEHCTAWISASLVKVEAAPEPPIPAVQPAPIAPPVVEPVPVEPAAIEPIPPSTTPEVQPVPSSTPEVKITSADPKEYIQYTVKTGVLKSVEKPTEAPGSYELRTPERNRLSHRICYLDTTDMNLSRFENETVRVYGNLRWREGERDPVMFVERVEMVW